MNKVKVTWNDFTKAIDILVKQITEDELGIEVIYGIPRGGLCIATSLSHRLGLPLTVKSKEISKYSKVLVVDDISDSGKTFNKILKKHGNKGELVTAAWHYASDRSEYEPDYWVDDNNGNWIEYPWEWS